MLRAAALLLAASASAPAAAPDCVQIDGPTTLAQNTARIQTALDAASKAGTQHDRGCVSVGVGDWPVAGVTVRSNSTLQIQPGARLVSKINVTSVAVVQVDKAEHVTLMGGGGIHGHAEEAWSYFSDKDARMSPVAVDGSMARPHTLLITDSKDVHVHHLFLHNSTDWTFRMDTSEDIYVDSVDIYGDSGRASMERAVAAGIAKPVATAEIKARTADGRVGVSVESWGSAAGPSLGCRLIYADGEMEDDAPVRAPTDAEIDAFLAQRATLAESEAQARAGFAAYRCTITDTGYVYSTAPGYAKAAGVAALWQHGDMNPANSCGRGAGVVIGMVELEDKVIVLAVQLDAYDGSVVLIGEAGTDRA